MTPLTVVLAKHASDEAWLKPFDPTQQGLITGGIGALVGGGIGGLGGLAFGRKGKRLSTGLKAALIGALGGGAVGGYLGHSGSKAMQDLYWNNELAPSWTSDPTGYMAHLKGQGGAIRKLYEGASHRSAPDQLAQMNKEIPSRWMPGAPGEDSIVRSSNAFRDRAKNAIRDIKVTPRQFGEYMAAGGPGELGFNGLAGDQLETAMGPDLNWSHGQGDPSSDLVDSLVSQYR